VRVKLTLRFPVSFRGDISSFSGCVERTSLLRAETAGAVASSRCVRAVVASRYPPQTLDAQSAKGFTWASFFLKCVHGHARSQQALLST
jgi:hypothetical protein